MKLFQYKKVNKNVGGYFNSTIGKSLNTSNPLRDNDRDGVINMHDCQPNNPFKKEVLPWEVAKKKLLSKDKYLYHKTEFHTAKHIIKTNKLKAGAGGHFSMSEDYNPNVIYKEYNNPTVLVLEKRKLKGVKKIDYNKLHEHSDIKFKSEKEWIIKSQPAKKAVKGIILNETTRIRKLNPDEPGMSRTIIASQPTRYVTGKDIQRVKFKG